MLLNQTANMIESKSNREIPGYRERSNQAMRHHRFAGTPYPCPGPFHFIGVPLQLVAAFAMKFLAVPKMKNVAQHCQPCKPRCPKDHDAAAARYTGGRSKLCSRL